ncbi:MAG TPA: HEAT repeat domain-containing protein [Galbitalea sp.]|nr:HEAT repeat domain-containing protein [Galbitalea sp.]
MTIRGVTDELSRGIDKEPIRVQREIAQLVDRAESLGAPSNAHLTQDHLQRNLARLLKEKQAAITAGRESAGLFGALSAVGVEVERLEDLGSDGRDDSRAVPVLLDCFRRTNSRALRSHILAALGREWASNDALDALFEEFQRIDPSADPGPNSVRWKIVGAIGQRVTVEWKDRLLKVASDPQNAEVRRQAIRGLARLGGARAELIPVFLEFLDSHDPDLFVPAAAALGAWRVPQARPRIQELIDVESSRDDRSDTHSLWVLGELRKALWRILPTSATR